MARVLSESTPMLHSQVDLELSYGSSDSTESQSQLCQDESWERVRYTSPLYSRKPRRPRIQRDCFSTVKNAICTFLQDRCFLRRTMLSYTIRRRSNYCTSRMYHQYFFKSKSLVVVLLINILYSTAIYGVTSEVLKVSLGADYVLTRLLILHSITQLLFPLAGHLADTYIGRHNIIRFSLWIAWISFAALGMTFSFESYHDEITTVNRVIVLPIIFVSLSVSYVCFVSNIIPFGLDQLQGASHMHYSSLFYWWYWTSNIGVVVVNVPQFCKNMMNMSVLIQAEIGLLCVSIAIVVDVLLKHWYVIEPTSRQDNPLRKIVLILCHALFKSKKSQRIPSMVRHELNLAKCGRLDLAKKRYGGRFETEHVENVRTFFQMMLVLVGVGFPVFSYSGVLGTVGMMVDHMSGTLPRLEVETVLCGVEVTLTDVISSLLLLALIPIIDLFIVPFLRYWALNPSILKRLSMGAILAFTSVLLPLLMEGFGGHAPMEEDSCMFNTYQETPVKLNVDVNWLFLPLVLVTLAEILIYIPSFEFICAQSPYNMRGLLIGIFFSIQGLFSLFSLLLLYLFSWYRVYNYPFQEKTGLPCEFWCYLIFVLVSFIGLFIFFVISCKYKRRKREDFFNEVTMIEEYYSSGI